MTKILPEEKDIHAGHRARVIESYSKIELSDLSPHQVLEYILFYVFPRGDVNPLAHRLLEKYGTIQNVLDANEHSLKEVYGINERSAKMLVGIIKIFDYYMNSKMSKKTKISGWNEIYDTCESLVRFQTREVLYIIALDASFRVINQRKLGTGTCAQVISSPNSICDFINETKAAFIILTHNHPGGVCKPSVIDINTNKKFKDIVKIMNAQFIDHIIVASDGIFSIEFNKKVRSFINTEDVRQIAEICSKSGK